MAEPEGPWFEGPPDAGSASNYRTWPSRPLPDPREAGQHKIASGLEEIIETEGPVRIDRAFHAYAQACGIARVGRVVRERLNAALESLERTGKVIVENEGPTNGDVDYRVARPKGAPAVVVRLDDSRTFWEVPPSEIGVVLANERRANRSADDESVYRNVIAKFGTSRLTRNIEAELKRIEQNFAKGR